MKYTKNEKRIIKALKDSMESLNSSELSLRTGINFKTIGRYFKSLEEKGRVSKEYKFEGNTRYTYVSLKSLRGIPKDNSFICYQWIKLIQAWKRTEKDKRDKEFEAIKERALEREKARLLKESEILRKISQKGGSSGLNDFSKAKKLIESNGFTIISKSTLRQLKTLLSKKKYNNNSLTTQKNVIISLLTEIIKD